MPLSLQDTLYIIIHLILYNDSILWRGKLRHREVGELAQGMTISKWQNWYFLPGSLVAGFFLLSSIVYSPLSPPRPPLQGLWEAVPPWSMESYYLCVLIIPPTHTLSSQLEFSILNLFFVYLNSLIFSHRKISIPQVFILQKYKVWENPTPSAEWNPMQEGKGAWLNSFILKERSLAIWYLYFKRSWNYQINLYLVKFQASYTKFKTYEYIGLNNI